MSTTIKETTQKIQEKINQCPINGKVVIEPGEYEIGSLFLKSNMTLEIGEGVLLKGSQELTDYPEIDTRVAGINMKWPAALINIIQCTNTKIIGSGKINGKGQKWWHLYWGEDETGGIRKEYSEKGLKWIVDYEVKRPRNILVQESQNILLQEFTSLDSGFWNTQILKSQQIKVEDITIKNGHGPSTDGIDIDSSREVVIKGCFVKCNDDNICIKSGRGKEAAKENIPSQKIIIEDCHLGLGSGITIGSEVSGGIEDILIQNNYFEGTGVGFRIKSAKNRGGYIRNIKVKNLNMKNVHYPFMFLLNWYPEYSYGNTDLQNNPKLPSHWKKVIDGVSGKAGLTNVENITIEQVTNKKDTEVFSRAFFIEGMPENPIKHLSFKNVSLEATEYGKISGITGLTFNHVKVDVANPTTDEHDTYIR